LLEYATASRAQCGTDRQLLSARERTREEQVADVGAGDQQNERDRAEQHDERHPDVANNQLLQRDHRRAPARICLRVLALEARRDRAHLRLRLLDGGAGFHPRDDLRIVVVAHRAIGVAVRERHPEIARRHRRRRDRKPRRHHADDRAAGGRR
jgi:hypothetical protein